MPRSEGQMSETMLSGALLAVTGGYLDVYTYLARGHVFANAQTGNMVLFGVNLARGNWSRAAAYLLPILAFVLGILLAAAVRERSAEKLLHWRQITVAVEILVLLAAGFIPAGGPDLPANTIVSFVCSVQVQSFRKIGGVPLATTMCTGNLRSAAECLYSCFRTKEREMGKKGLRYLCIILFFILGAVIGSVLTALFSVRAVLFSCIPLLAVFLLMFRREKKTEEKSS